MKRKILTAVFACLLIALVSVTASAKQVDSFETSSDKYGFSFAVKEDGINVSGCVANEDMHYVYIEAHKAYIVAVEPDVKFSAMIALPEGTNKCEIKIYLGQEATSTSPYTEIFSSGDIILEKIDGKWGFTVDDKILENNETWFSGWVNPALHLDKNQPESVKMVTKTVIDGLTTDYEKAYAIHKWVAENIYYDKDYAFNTKTYTALTPVDVLTQRVSVCEGYSNLMVAMLNAAGIPAFKVGGYLLGNDASVWSEVSPTVSANHAWVEAYIDGKWIIADPTWDSKNMCNNGVKETNPVIAFRYFDITPFALSAKHKIISRPNTFGKDGVSDWAYEETMQADILGLVTDSVSKTMKDKITRRDFCDLVVNMLTKKLNKPIKTILNDKNVKVNYEAFKDTTEYNILCANALGIVNGKENNMFDPKGYITRQEAAVMLQRTAKVLGVTKANSTSLTFADADKFPSWSAEAIKFVSASLSSKGTRVMGGVQGNKFDHTGFYTKEQSVLTIYRLFEAY